MAMSPDDAKRLISYYGDINAELREQAENLRGIRNTDERRKLAIEEIANNQRVINELEKEYLAGNEAVKGELDKINAVQKTLLEKEKNVNKQLERQVKNRKLTVDLARQLGVQLKIGWKYLQDQDKIIKSTILNLGMSSAKAAAMRDAFKHSAGYVIDIGGSMADIQTVMQGYAEETGRARVMTADMVKDIVDIGKGTGLSVEEATRLGAQFELMGFDARGTADYVQGVVDTSERMGVNTTKVLKVVNDNFKRLNTYTFQQGVKGFAQMAMYAEKFKIDINQALNAADVARSLEGAIDLAAQLQIMGGEFAKTDPFEMLFLARNDPAKFTEKIADMTKGVVSFRKMADGTFEKFISPADRDRLRNVAKSLGMEADALTQITERQAEIQRMRQQMAGMGLTAEQKEIIEGAAQWDKETGKFQVELGGLMRDISSLTSDQADAFKIEQKLLKDRAEEAMTFDDKFKATIEILKTTFLPLLDKINTVLLPRLAKIAEKFIKFAEQGTWGMIKAAGMLMGPALIFKTASNLISRSLGRAGGAVLSRMGGGTKGLSNILTPTADSKSGLFEQRKGIGMAAAGKGAGMAAVGKGVGIGAAGAGVGAGIMLAAKGIGDLAQSIKDVDVNKLKEMNKTVAILGGTMVGILVPAIFAIGAAGTAGALGLLAVGAAVVGIGFGIKLATEGIGHMALGLAEMNKSGGGAGKQLLGVAGGIAAITVAMAAGGFLGLMTFNKGLRRIARHSEGIEKIGIAFKNINAVLSGSRDDFIAVENAVKSISNANIRGGGMFTELANLLKKPLQVEFANNGRVSMTNDITLNLDGKRFMNKAYDVNIAVQKHESLRQGKGS
jgi:hypothetical protein